MRFMRNVNDGQVTINNGQVSAEDFFVAHEVRNTDINPTETTATDWTKDFEDGKQRNCS